MYWVTIKDELGKEWFGRSFWDTLMKPNNCWTLWVYMIPMYMYTLRCWTSCLAQVHTSYILIAARLSLLWAVVSVLQFFSVVIDDEISFLFILPSIFFLRNMPLFFHPWGWQMGTLMAAHLDGPSTPHGLHLISFAISAAFGHHVSPDARSRKIQLLFPSRFANTRALIGVGFWFHLQILF